MIKKIIKYIIKYILLPLCCLFIIFPTCFGISLEFTLLGSLILVLGINFMAGVIMIPITIWKTIAKQTIKFEKLNKEDLFKNNELYREILNNISPSVLSYIDNMSFKFEAIVISTLLNLKRKNYLNFDNNKLIKLNSSNNMDLNFTENYILNSISNGKVNITKNDLQNNIIKDALKEDIIKANNDIGKSSLGKAIPILMCIFPLLILILLFIGDNMFSSFIGIIVFITVITYPIGLIAYLATYCIKYNNNPFFRTKKGNEINKKLEGLKNYIKEYSLLKEKDDKSLELWEDYLIYSVIFEQNNKIQKDYFEYIILN